MSASTSLLSDHQEHDCILNIQLVPGYRNCVPPGFKYCIYCKEIITQDIVDLIAKKGKELVFNDWRKITKKIAFYEDILHRYTEYKVRVLVVAFEILHLLFCNFLCVFYPEISICSNYIQ